MEIGTLNQRITILENRVVTDEIGNHTAVGRGFSCWARVSVKSSSEQVNTGISREMQSVSVSYSAELLYAVCNATSHRILFQWTDI